MPEASAAGRNRWYRVKWPDQRNLSPAWAEKYFDNHTEAFYYFERRRGEHPTGRVHRARAIAREAHCLGRLRGPGMTGGFR
jgi:hypothetical protein